MAQTDGTHETQNESTTRSVGVQLPVGRAPLTIDDVRMIATYAPDGVTDDEVEDLVRRVEHMHGILPPCAT